MNNSAASTIDHEDVERFSRIAEEWWDPNGKFRPLHQMNPLRISYIRDQITASTNQSPPFENLSLLDIGCGGGLISEPLQRLSCSVTGIDASEQNIKVASNHAKQSDLEIHYQVTTAEALASQKQQYDIVLALEIVEHVADVPLFLASCATLVKPGGILMLSTLNRTLKSFLMAKIGAEYILRWLPRGTHQWHQFLLPSEIETELKPHNMELTNLSGMVFNPLKNSWSLSPTDTDVNYLMSFVKK